MTIPRGLRRTSGVLVALTLGVGLIPGQAAVAAAGNRPADDGAAIVEETWINARTVDLTVRSPAVGQTMKNRVIVPKGWRRNAARTYPTIYLYGGGGGDDHTIWQQKTEVVRLAAQWDAMVVMPFNGAVGGFVNHFNYGKWGKPAWQTFHTVELQQLVERNLRGGRSRAVMGVSAGALGAMAYAGRKPGNFKFVGALSGTLHTRKPAVPQILMLLNAGTRWENDPYKIWGIPGIHDANWRAHDPYELAPKLRGTKLYVSAGTTGNRGPLDPKDLPIEKAIELRIIGGLSEQVCGDTTRSFVQRLRQLNIPVTTHIYGNGWHAWPYWNREAKSAWPMAMKAIGAKRVA